MPVSVGDANNSPLTYSATGLPSGLTVNSTTGLISGTIATGADSGSPYAVTVTASDGTVSATQTFNWTVAHVSLVNPGPLSSLDGQVVSLQVQGGDADGDTLTYTTTGLPSGLSISSSGLISGTLAANADTNSPYNVTVTASDGVHSSSVTFLWTVSQVSLGLPSDPTNTEGDSVSLQLSATGGTGITYQASGLPSGLSINSSTGLISGTVASGDAANGPYFVLITATDALGNNSGQWLIWNVNPTNLNPVVSNPGSQINTQGDVLTLPIEATDPAGNGLTYSATGLPPGLTIDPSSGLISGVLSATSAAGSPYTATVTATDGTYSGSATITWSVTNQAVTVTNPGTQSSTGGNAVSLQISASDPAQLPLTYAAAGLPDGLSINASTGLISGTIDASAGGAFAVTVMASDSQGNSGSVSFTWNVTYLNQAPTLANPCDQLNQAGDAVSLPLFGYDVDGDAVTYSAAGLPPGLSINPTTGIISGTLAATAGSGTPYSVTITASDGTLTAIQTFNWFVTANTVTLTNPGDQTNTEGDSVSLQLSATGSGLTYSASGLPSGLSLNSATGLISGTIAAGDAANGFYTVTVTAADSQAHSSAQQFTWTINTPANSLALTNPGS